MDHGVAGAALFHAARVCADPAGSIARWKALTGGKVVGCLAPHVPEETVAASGMLPVTIWGDEFQGSPSAPDLPETLSPLDRGVVLAIRGGLWRHVDAWALPSSRAVFGDCEKLLGFAKDHRPVFRFGPPDDSGDALVEMLDRTEAFIEWAGALSGKPVSDGAIERAVRASNENRRLFAALMERMTKVPGLFSAVEFRCLARSGMILPRSAHRKVLDGALRREIPWNGSPTGTERIHGTIASLRDMEELDARGVAVVGDCTAAGARFYETWPDECGDMALLLAKRLLSRE